ncbi:MAG UNVERIFIED_CONTAM: hypothetical protein LVT10_27295 [Anaerolineae bacterium]
MRRSPSSMVATFSVANASKAHTKAVNSRPVKDEGNGQRNGNDHRRSTS